MTDFYDFAAPATRVVASLIAHLEVDGRDNLPARGPVILCPNHRTMADPPLIAGLLPRRIYYMVKQEAWDTLFFGALARGFKAFPVRRGEADLGAYRQALKLLADGKVVGIFPEGHRSKDGRLLLGQPGAVILAQRSRAPIVPVAMAGLAEALAWPGVVQRRTVRLVVGEPYEVPRTPREEVPRLTAELMERIARLLPPEENAKNEKRKTK